MADIFKHIQIVGVPIVGVQIVCNVLREQERPITSSPNIDVDAVQRITLFHFVGTSVFRHFQQLGRGNDRKMFVGRVVVNVFLGDRPLQHAFHDTPIPTIHYGEVLRSYTIHKNYRRHYRREFPALRCASSPDLECM